MSIPEDLFNLMNKKKIQDELNQDEIDDDKGMSEYERTMKGLYYVYINEYSDFEKSGKKKPDILSKCIRILEVMDKLVQPEEEVMPVGEGYTWAEIIKDDMKMIKIELDDNDKPTRD